MSCTVKGLLECAKANVDDNWGLGAFTQKLVSGQIRQYLELKEAGADDNDDVDEALEHFPQCNLKLF